MSETGEQRAGDAAGQRSDVDRADELIEEWGQRVGIWLSRTAARAREEAEDIWAEAQSVRRGEKA
jgi:hypothetical protein